MNISMLSTVACCAPRFLARVFFILLAFGASINAKVFERCEFAKVLHHKHSLSLQEVAVWTCIAQHSSNFNTEAHASDLTGGSHGLFQISDEFWCSTALKRGECNLQCERLYDADLTDDLSCARTIYNEHQRLSGNGYQAWKAYQQYCSYDVEHYTKDCFSNPWLSAKAQQHIAHASNAYTAVGDGSPTSAHAPSASASANAHATVSFYSPPTAKINSNSFGSRYSTHKTGKIYDRCELAQELYYKHKIPMEQVPTWVCIAQHESRFDTAAVGRLNADGSADHGIFQISDLYWCSHDYSNGGKACGMDCTKLLDNDISDDVRCIKRVHGEHTGITGDGFMAWSVYDKNCRNQQYNFIASCFKDQAYQHTAETNIKTTMENPTPHIYHANPYLQHISVAHKPTPTPTLQHTYTSYTSQKQTQKGKIYERCELAKELYFKHKFPMQDIATWVCIAQYESNFNTAAVGRLSGGGSADHGLFQISDLYWCTHDEQGGKACGISCAKLLDADLSDDVECVRRIHEEHTRLSGNGFTAWTVYNSRCHNQQYEEIANCFDSYNEISKQQNLSTSTQVGADNRHKSVEQAVAKGKIYEECELARELYYKHGMPLMDIPTWVCIAEHESHFDTSAVGRRNADGSVDHGIFQISDLYWCAHGQWAARKACGLTCDKLLDANISDDLKCAKIIYAEHTRLAGDGFTAWRVYNRSCSKEQLTRVSHCFAADIVKKAQPGTSATDALQTNGTSVGKMYEKCELAQELYFKHKIPMKDVPTWVCIAEHESSYNTAAVGRSHADGSADHGLFQISDLYCSANDNSVGGKACGISCNKLLDNDLADDMRCVKIIFDEHTRLTGNGFTAWTAYERNCQEQSLEQIRACFDVKEMQQAQQASGVRQTATKVSTQKQTRITPSRTKQTTAKSGHSKLYINSEIFRTTPGRMQTTFLQPKPTPETQKLYNSFSKPYINTEIFRTMPVKPQASLEQPKPIPGTQKITKITTKVMPSTSTVSTKTTQKPSSQRTKEYFSTFLSTTTTKMPTAFSTAKQSPTYDKTQKVTRTQRPSITLSTTTATKIPETVRRIKTTTKAPYTTVSTTKLTNNQKTSTVPGSISRTTSAYTARKPLQQKQAISSSTAVGSTRNPGQPQMQRTTSTKTNKPTTYSSVSNTITTKSTRQPSTTNTPRSTTRMGTPTTQKASFKAKTTSRPTTVRTSTTENTRTEPNTTRPSTATYQNTNTKSVTKAIKNQYLYTTTTRTPISITRKPVSTTKSATRPTTATQSTTKKPQIQRYVSTSTRNPTAAIRPEITQKLYTTTKTPTTVKTTRRTFAGSSNLSTTTKVPYSTTKQNITNSFNRFNKKSQASTTTTRPYTRTTTASRATTRKHATTETIKSAFGSRRPTTLKPKATVSSNVTTPNPYRDHPFGHPFFAKSNDKFKALTSIPTTTTTRKSSTNPTTKYKSRVRVSEESKYYQQFKNHTTGNVKTVYAYSFGRNSTVAGFYGR
ncbi:uncharacterized protein [Eurosta solidaginis]|uniref:uncharacterized protein isoform X3 n=1 Tax=Eurosta solidaginis TaxID=178769 RepID=UPI0035316603